MPAGPGFSNGAGQAALCFPLIYVLGEPELWGVFYEWLPKNLSYDML